MAWSLLLVRFLAGLFLANGIPHFIHGMSGRPFPTPFAHPPGVGDSSPVTNVLWGFANFLGGALLLGAIAPYQPGYNGETAAAALGALVLAIVLAWHFGRGRATAGRL
ncbi:MAG TPA: hypothetical protein VNK45_11530 [Candidatus Acidoferrales bacterium]|nr:hypothetical protein [Candidatus Acidoferrales bacterium]